jgi:hypothetical protein
MAELTKLLLQSKKEEMENSKAPLTDLLSQFIANMPPSVVCFSFLFFYF